jgi:Copper type II ascorbate-dependent monooxygenase, C-terminal domain
MISKLGMNNASMCSLNGSKIFAHVKNRFDSPVTLQPGDEIRVDCTYRSLGKNTTTYYGDGTSDEMCFAFLTYYPANDNFSSCLQWRSVNLCSNVPMQCDMDSFQSLVKSVSTVCSLGCSTTCRLVMMALLDTHCMSGEIGQFLSTMDSQGMMALNGVVKMCGIPMTDMGTTTMYPGVTGLPPGNRCDLNTFMQLSEFLPVICSANNCSDSCKLTVMAMMNMGCATGDSLQYLMSKDRDGMMWLYGLINWCNIPMTMNPMPSTRAPPPPAVNGAVPTTKTAVSLAATVSAASLLLFLLDG